jgi:hypothetical protein
MILKYLAVFSFILTAPALANERDTLPWQSLDDTELHRFALQLGDRLDPEEIFGEPAMTRADGVRVRVYPKGTSDLLIVETRPGNRESPELERFHAVRLKRAFEAKTAGREAGTIRTVWEIRVRTEPPAKNWLQRLVR